MRIYFAAPLFSHAERSFNIQLAEKIETLGHVVFLPQRDGAEKKLSNYYELGKEERRIAIFKQDYEQIKAANIFLFILDGRIPDEGACVELGIAFNEKKENDKNKILIGLHTDSRAAFLGSKLNPMIKVPLERIFETEDELIKYLEGIGNLT